MRAGERRALGRQACAGDPAAIADGRRPPDRFNTTPAGLAAPGAISTFAAAALAGFISVTIFSTVAYLFQRDGKPLQQLASAERACAHYSYASERQVCMNEWLAASQGTRVASHGTRVAGP